MVAGILSPDPSRRFGNFRKNDVAYINLIDNKAAVAVGDCALSSEDMYMSGGRGKCLLLLHVYEDELCKFGGIVTLPQHGPAFAKSVDEPEPTIPCQNEKQSYANSVKQENRPSVNEAIFENLRIEETAEETAIPALSSDDDIVSYCFLKALNTSVKNVKLPLLISNFYKVHMIPACPEGKTVDIKKSRFKKMSKLVQEMAAENVIKIEETSPGVQSICDVNFSHHLLSGFVDDQPTSSSKEDKVEQPKVSEKYSVTAAVLPLFSEFLIK